MTNTLIQFRIDEELKNEATEIYEDLGLDMSSAIKLFLKRTVKLKTLPFDLNTNDFLENNLQQKKIQALNELDKMNLNFSKNTNEKDEIYNAIMEKYESIN
ncbi:MAG: type II toxin-antitoxin system RelB/DinJ family antitoxin [Lachnospiraceae bacterium]|nr:type II toxin-antitoxin system RelB/DinJ family antitoxin [Lachnospiraceae bacterium]